MIGFPRPFPIALASDMPPTPPSLSFPRSKRSANHPLPVLSHCILSCAPFLFFLVLISDRRLGPAEALFCSRGIEREGWEGSLVGIPPVRLGGTTGLRSVVLRSTSTCTSSQLQIRKTHTHKQEVRHGRW